MRAETGKSFFVILGIVIIICFSTLSIFWFMSNSRNFVTIGGFLGCLLGGVGLVAVGLRRNK